MKREPEYRIADELVREYHRARAKFAPMNSPHEGYGVLLEEMDELWDEVRAHDHDKTKLRAEAIQVGAMALRFIHDVCDEPKLDEPDGYHRSKRRKVLARRLAHVQERNGGDFDTAEASALRWILADEQRLRRELDDALAEVGRLRGAIERAIPEVCPRCEKVEQHPLHDVDGDLRHSYAGDLLGTCCASTLHRALAEKGADDDTA